MCVGGELLLDSLLFLTHFVFDLLFHIIIYFRDVNMLLSPAQTLQVIYLRLTCDWAFELLVTVCNRRHTLQELSYLPGTARNTLQ